MKRLGLDWRDVEGPLLAKRWEIDCVDTTLTQNDTDKPVTYRGKGYLRQDADGVVCFRLYPPAEGFSAPSWDGTAGRNAGKLVPGDAYYSLSATDWYGRVWKCPRVDPDVSTTYCGAQPHGQVSGKAYDLRCDEKSWVSEDVYFLRMVWGVDLELPATTGTEVITMLGGKEAGRSSTLNAAIFETEFGLFKILTEPGRLIVTCEADTPPDTHFFVRVMESLSFVLGRRLYWNYVEEHRLGTKTTRLRGQQQSDERHLPEPVGGSRRDRAGHTWLLFSDHLRYIASHEGGGLHPCSKHLFAVLQAQQGTIEAKALALGVAVEGLCKDLFPESPEAEARMKKWVKDLRTHCEGWGGFADSAARTALYDRLGGLIGQLTGVRAKDILVRLTFDGAVSDRHVKAWSRLRNQAAHANTKVGDSLQELVSLCDAVTVLLYQLVFKAIGYEGMYTDYSEYGYPPKRYRGRAVREEEIAIAAYFLWKAGSRQAGKDKEHWFKARTLLESGAI
jgi:hypothetical protein